MSLKFKWWILLVLYVLIFGLAGVAINILKIVYFESPNNLTVSICTHWNETCLNLCEDAQEDPTKNTNCPNCCEAYIDKPISLSEKIKYEANAYFIFFGFIGFLVFAGTHDIKKYFPEGVYR